MEPVKGYKGLYIYKGKRDEVFYASVRDRNGMWVKKPVGKKSRGMTPKTAHAEAVRLQDELDGKKDMGKTTFQDAHDNFIRTREAKRANTKWNIQRWDLYLSRFKSIPLDKLRTEDFQDLVIDLRKKGLADGYLEKIFGQARSYFSWAIKAGIWQGVNPLGRDSLFEMPNWKSTAKPTRWFTPQEADRLLEEIRKRSEQLYRMSLLSLRTGMRALEIFGLGDEIDAIDEVNGVLNFVGKSKKREHVYVSRDVLKLLKEYDRQPGELIFQSTNGERIKGISYSFVRAVEAAGLASDKQKVWFHSWRHTFGSWLAQSGEFSLHEIMEYMRHTDTRMTQHYAKLIPGQKRNRLEIIQEKLALVREGNTNNVVDVKAMGLIRNSTR